MAGYYGREGDGSTPGDSLEGYAKEHGLNTFAEVSPHMAKHASGGIVPGCPTNTQTPQALQLEAEAEAYVIHLATAIALQNSAKRYAKLVSNRKLAEAEPLLKQMRQQIKTIRNIQLGNSKKDRD